MIIANDRHMSAGQRSKEVVGRITMVRFHRLQERRLMWVILLRTRALQWPFSSRRGFNETREVVDSNLQSRFRF
jgi:hypothetical protein